MHTRWLTVFILRHFLVREATTRAATELSPRGLLFSAGAIALFHYFEFRTGEFLLIGGLIYYLGQRAWSGLRARPLLSIIEEIRSGTFDGPEVARRLRGLEHRRIYVHSLVLSLLELDAQQDVHRTPRPQ